MSGVAWSGQLQVRVGVVVSGDAWSGQLQVRSGCGCEWRRLVRTASGDQQSGSSANDNGDFVNRDDEI